MYNIFKPRKKRKKLNVTDDLVVGFLNGSYEKQIFGSELLGIRSIEVSYRNNDVNIFLAKDFQGDKPRIKHKNGLKPFLWGKELNSSFFFTHNVVTVHQSKVNDTHAILPNGEIRAIDNDNVRILGKNSDGDYHIRYKIESIKEWERIVNKKQKLYGIEYEEQITSFDGKKVQRMENGFNMKFTIKNQSESPKISDNPFFQRDRYGRNMKIKGSFTNLLDFFREGGVSPRGSAYLDDKKLYDWFEFLSLDKDALNLFYLGIYKWRLFFNPFDKTSVDWKRIIKIYKEKHPSIDFKINKSYINAVIEDDYLKFYDLIKSSKLYSDDIFNIQLDDKKIIDYIIQCFTFDGSPDQKELYHFLNDRGIDIFRVFESKLFFVNPREQYMIQTGRRLFKGIENYEDLHILTLDIETKAQDGNEHIGIAALKPELGRVFQIGVGDNRGYEELLDAKTEDEEQSILEKTYEIVAEQDPDIVLTYNGEGFDFPFMEKRLELLGCVAQDDISGGETSAQYIRNLIAPHFEKYGELFSFFFYRRQEKSKVKIGGGTEDYTQTKMIGKNICDVMFAVKRAMAIDNNIPNARLKDNVIHANLARPNRVYVKGDLIGAIDSDPRPYYFNKDTGEYFVSKKGIEFVDEKYDSKLIRQGENGKFYGNKNKLYLYAEDGKNKSIIADCFNAYPVILHNNGVLFNDSTPQFKKQCIEIIDANFYGFYKKVLNYDGIVAPFSGFGQQLHNQRGRYGYIPCKEVLAHLKSKLKMIRANFDNISKIHKILCQNGFEKSNGKSVAKHLETNDVPEGCISDWNNYKLVSGSYIIERYLKDDIEEPYLLDKLYSQATFEVCKWLPTSYEKVATMGNANVWKLILSAWSYLNCIGIPDYEPPREYTGGLLGMVSAGFHRNIVKIDYSSLYPSEFLEHVSDPDIDISGIYKPLVRYGLYTRLDYKDKKNKAKAEGNSEMEQYYDKKQLPLKILINSFYGMLGAPKVSPFCHIKSAWHITCSGRQHMRHLIHYFKPRGFKIIYFHTDGANFVIPENVDDYTYISDGSNWKNDKGKKYTGVEAYVAEYNDKFMKGKMAVDIDEYAISCINFSKGNFSYLKEKKGKLKISHVGGTLVKKNQNEYIQDFFKENLETLFLGDGSAFLDAYYSYVKKIYNQDIVAGKIANKARVKKDPQDYLKHVKEGGNKLAHMELIIMNNLNVNVGDWVYYINDGKGKVGDLSTEHNTIGYFSYETKEEAYKTEEHLNHLMSYSRDAVSEYVFSAESGGIFTFKYTTVPINDPTSKRKTERISKKELMGEINDVNSIKFKVSKKVTKTKGTEYIVELIFTNQYLNSKIVSKEELDAKLAYNPIKYIEKFNKSLENIWIVFHPDIRPKIPTPNRARNTGESYDRNPTQRGWFLENELELVSGHPLKGHEHKQNDLDELMVVTDEEMEFWELAGLSPNNSLDYKSIDYSGTYYVNSNNGEIHKNANLDCDLLMNGKELSEWLKDKIILDYENPPYVFVD